MDSRGMMAMQSAILFSKETDEILALKATLKQIILTNFTFNIFFACNNIQY